MNISLLKLHWLSKKRSPFWAKNLVTNIALGFMGLYMLAFAFKIVFVCFSFGYGFAWTLSLILKQVKKHFEN